MCSRTHNARFPTSARLGLGHGSRIATQLSDLRHGSRGGRCGRSRPAASRGRLALQRGLQRGMRCSYRGVARPRPRGRLPYKLARAPPIQKIYRRANPLRPARAPRLQRRYSGVCAEARAGASVTVGWLSGVCAGGPARAGVSSGRWDIGNRRGIRIDRRWTTRDGWRVGGSHQHPTLRVSGSHDGLYAPPVS
jgi:hypothetical protein